MIDFLKYFFIYFTIISLIVIQIELTDIKNNLNDCCNNQNQITNEEVKDEQG